MKKLSKNTSQWYQNEEGQSIILIAFALIVVLAFVGIAVDTGFVFARQTQLRRAVDAAALAGVTEVVDVADLSAADRRATQFMITNDIPLTVTESINFESAGLTTQLGATQYTVTATWPIDLFFLSVIGRDQVALRETATAAYFSLTDVYASRRIEDGALTTSNQAVFGPYMCSGWGDPYSPLLPNWANGSNEFVGEYTWRYRILIPPEYPEDKILRVELFDPDGWNEDTNGAGNTAATETVQQMFHTDAAITTGMSVFSSSACGDPNLTGTYSDQSQYQTQPCLLATGEADLGISVDQINPWWFIRVDSNAKVTNPNQIPAVGCNGNLDHNGYNNVNSTQTLYELYYYRESSDGSIQRGPVLASYYGQTGDNRDLGLNCAPGPNGVSYCDASQAGGDHQSDMRWVSPGGLPLFDRPEPAASRFPDVDVPAHAGSFEVDLRNYPDMAVDQTTGYRYLYLDITPKSGSAENGFEVWAGPRDYADRKYWDDLGETDPTPDVAGDVNVRNVAVINDPTIHSSLGVTVFAIGNLPMNSNFRNPVDIPLIYVPPEFAGETIRVSLFDPDTPGTEGPITFYFDSLAFEADDSNTTTGYNPDGTDWAMVFDPGDDGDDDDGVTDGTRCELDGNGCDNKWVDPPYEITVPNFTDACPLNPTPQEQRDYCTPFYGGRLIARYQTGFGDTFTWKINLVGDPYLVD